MRRQTLDPLSIWTRRVGGWGAFPTPHSLLVARTRDLPNWAASKKPAYNYSVTLPGGSAMRIRGALFLASVLPLAVSLGSGASRSRGGHELIVYSAAKDGNGGEINTMWPDGSHNMQLTFAREADIYGEVSPNGEIAFVRVFPELPNTYEIYRMNFNGSNQTRLTFDRVVNYAPTWSPDGSKILFVSSRDADWELYTMNRDGSNVQRLTVHKGSDINPDWSPDGRQIVFSRGERVGNGEKRALCIMNADGTNAHAIHSSSYEYYSKWSPDGSRILFSTIGVGGDALYTIRPDGSDVRRLISDGGYAGGFWSPDGSEIVFSSWHSQPPYSQVRVMNSDGTNVRVLLESDFTGYSVSDWWSGK
jgi:hypothetical protein